MLTRNECLRILNGINASKTPAEPIFLADPGIWQADGWYYFLWENEKYNVLMFSGHSDPKRYRYYVQHWKKPHAPTRTELIQIIREHAIKVKRATLEHSVAINRSMDNETSVWGTHELEFEVPHDGGEGCLAHITGPDQLYSPRERGWIMLNLTGIKHSIAQGHDRATLETMMLFNKYLVSAWKGNRVYKAITGWHQLAAIYVRDMIAELYHQKKQSTSRFVKGLYAVWGAMVMATTTSINPIGLPKVLLAFARDCIGVFSRKKGQTHAGEWPEIEELSTPSNDISPFDQYYRRIRSDVLDSGRYLEHPDFGRAGLIPSYHVQPTIESAELCRLCRPNRATLVRFFFFRDAAGAITKRVGAVRFYRPDGFTVTLEVETDTVYFSYAKKRCVFSGSPRISGALRKRFTSLRNQYKEGAILMTKNLLDPETLHPVYPAELNARFMDNYGAPFRG